MEAADHQNHPGAVFPGPQQMNDREPSWTLGYTKLKLMVDTRVDITMDPLYVDPLHHEE